MARFVDTVMTSIWSEDDAFSYMADARNFAEWDPGTGRVEQVRGHGAGADAAFDVTAKVGSRTTVLHYQVTDWKPSRRVVLEASNALMRLRDEIDIDRVDTDTLITYDARITLRGPLKLFDAMLERRFQAIGERAAAGLRERVQQPR
jgi:carbon monoxide dehydrogenase subunit G